MRLHVMVMVPLCFAASPVLAEEILYCIDTDVAGFKWDNKGQASKDGVIGRQLVDS